MIAGTFYGAFVISGQAIKPLAKEQHFASEYKGVSTMDAIADILNRLRILRP
jgi:hypothetical protein